VKNIVFIIGLLIVLKPVFPVVDYMVNYKYIATVLCENKDKPELNCCGKCHLKKELAKEAENDKPLSSDKKSSQKQEVEFYYYSKSESLVESIRLVRNTFTIHSVYSDLYSFLNSVFVFHPPIAS
jgi:hypothetical protein